MSLVFCLIVWFFPFKYLCLLKFNGYSKFTDLIQKIEHYQKNYFVIYDEEFYRILFLNRNKFTSWLVMNAFNDTIIKTAPNINTRFIFYVSDLNPFLVGAHYIEMRMNVGIYGDVIVWTLNNPQSYFKRKKHIQNAWKPLVFSSLYRRIYFRYWYKLYIVLYTKWVFLHRSINPSLQQSHPDVDAIAINLSKIYRFILFLFSIFRMFALISLLLENLTSQLAENLPVCKKI